MVHHRDRERERERGREREIPEGRDRGDGITRLLAVTERDRQERRFERFDSPGCCRERERERERVSYLRGERQRR